MMNSKKKQTVAAAMATALGITAMVSPVVHAQEEDAAPAITQGTVTEPAQDESNTPTSPTQNEQQYDNDDSGNGSKLIEQEQLIDKATASSVLMTITSSHTDDAFTDFLVATKAVENALWAYEFSNETTEQKILDYLNHEFVDTGKLKNFEDISLNKTNATEASTGVIIVTVHYYLFNDSRRITTSIKTTIPRLPKNGEVAINSMNFPDKLFRDYLKKEKNKNSDGVLDADEINQLTTVDITANDYRGITSLKGIEYFPMLEYLDCSNTDISNLNVSKNQNLKYLYCSKTGISELDVSKNLNLLTLNCFNTSISKLDVSKNLNLMELDCYNTDISELDVSSNTNLQILMCEDTPLTWLNLGNQFNFIGGGFTIPSPSIINLAVSDHTFDMTQAFKG